MSRPITNETSIALYRTAAEAGDAEGQFGLGFYLWTGSGIEKNEKEAVQLFLKAAKQGHPGAQFNLGVCLQSGLGVEKNKKEAVQWLLEAAKQGHPGAQFNLGVCLKKGDGVEKDVKEALKWFFKAEQHSHDVESQFQLGHLLHKEEAVKDLNQAADWYRKAAGQGSAGALSDLGVLLEETGIEANIREAVQCYLGAAQRNHFIAQYNLGRCLEIGYGTKKDEAQAVNWYYESAIQGWHQSQFHLGLCLEKGIGTEKDEVTAIKWYRSAAKQNYDKAQFQLGTCLEKGIGTRPNSSGAILWYCRAALQEHKEAIETLKREQISGEQKLGFRETNNNTALTTKEIIEVINGLKSVGSAKSDDSRLVGDLVVHSFSNGVIATKEDLELVLTTLLENNSISEEKSISCLMIKDCITRLPLVITPDTITPLVEAAPESISSAGIGVDLGLGNEITPPSHSTTEASVLTAPTISEEEISPLLLTDKKPTLLLTDRVNDKEETRPTSVSNPEAKATQPPLTDRELMAERSLSTSNNNLGIDSDDREEPPYSAHTPETLITSPIPLTSRNSEEEMPESPLASVRAVSGTFTFDPHLKTIDQAPSATATTSNQEIGTTTPSSNSNQTKVGPVPVSRGKYAQTKPTDLNTSDASRLTGGGLYLNVREKLKPVVATPPSKTPLLPESSAQSLASKPKTQSHIPG